MAGYDMLNEQQQKGMFTTEGPVLILAGAGSGKTRVLIHRAAYLIEEKGVNPYNILAITFTNKAAGEMRERIRQMVEFGGDGVWVSTFHALCVRILRRYIDRLGYDTNFTIYDTDDQKTLMKDICKRLEIDTKIHKEKMFLNAISSAKDELIDPVEFDLRAAGDYNKRRQAEVYREYQNALRLNNALDFDDLLFKTVELFRLDKEVLSSYQERFRYIMVDEYQDTNTAQFELVRLIAMKYKNLCVVGDDDQSIYRFRGANIYNILNFEQHFPEAVVIKLEQNYRSTQNILDAANSVISNNVGRKEKALWTDHGSGDKIRFEQVENGYEEADLVVRDIVMRVQKGDYQYQDCAVLYRTNAQSRLFEERFLVSNIPYKIVGGVNFYSRKEIKDLLCYLKTVDNGRDEIAVRRILNIPRRGIGAATIGRVADYSARLSISFYEALCQASQIPRIGKAGAKIAEFISLIESMRKLSKEASVSELLKEIIQQTGYVEELEAEGTDEAQSRIENIDELLTKAVSYEQEAKEPSLSGFLEEVALVADVDSLEENSNYVVLMTLHSAKGLEFSNVYMAGMEDGLFPSHMSIIGDDAPEAIEEERRLAYVGITRAKERLTITSARMRMLRGEAHYGMVSRFVKEIPEGLLQGKIFEAKQREELRDETAYQKARRAFRMNSTSYSEMEGGGAYRTNGPGAGNQRIKKAPVRYTPVENQQSFSSDHTRSQTLTYTVGDRVRHMKFGEGEVRAIVEGGRDYEVTVDFDKAGTKKMFASFAKLKKV